MNKVILFLLVFNSLLSAQVNVEWTRTYNPVSPGGHYADKGAVDKFGNFIVAGRSDSAGSPDFITLKYSSSGNLLWSRRYNGIGTGFEFFRDMILDDSGNVYITGSSNEGSANGYSNFVTIKYSSNGELRWRNSLDWTAHKEDVPFSITLDKQNNVYVTGYGWAPPYPPYENFDIVLVKYSSDGIQLWTGSYNAQGYVPDWGYSVVTDDSDFVYVSGYSYFNEPIIATIKFDTDGNQIWVKQFPRNTSEYAIKLYSKMDKQNNVIVNGLYDYGSFNFVTLKYDRNGNLLWSKVFETPWNHLDVCNALYTDDSLNIYIAGVAWTNHYNDALVVKYAPNGDTLWIRYYDGGDVYDALNSVTVDSLGNVYATGKTVLSSTIDDFLTLKYNSNGNLIWKKIYSRPYQNMAYVIALDNYRNIFVAGYNDLGISNDELVVIKYSQLTGISNQTETEIQSSELNNYPNPFNPNTIINYKLYKKGSVVLKIYDISGKEIRIVNNKIQEAGMHSVLFEGNNLPSGIYFYSLHIDGNLVQTKKMILTR